MKKLIRIIWDWVCPPEETAVSKVEFLFNKDGKWIIVERMEK